MNFKPLAFVICFVSFAAILFAQNSVIVTGPRQTITGTTLSLNHHNLNEKRTDCVPLWVDKLRDHWSIGFDSKWCYIEIAPLPPFDVPPVDTTGPDTFADQHPDVCSGDVAWMGQRETCDKKIDHTACADKSRFLLMSEDRKWHCLALTGKP